MNLFIFRQISPKFHVYFFTFHAREKKDFEFRCDFLPKYPFRIYQYTAETKANLVMMRHCFGSHDQNVCVGTTNDGMCSWKIYGVINNHFILFNHLWIFIYSLFAAGNMNAQPLFLYYITVDFYIFFLVFRSHIINAYAINVKPRTLSIKTHNEATENAFWYSFRLFRCLSNWAILHQQTKLLKHF